jgi:outer membrane receptor protein involved in Fe transport
MAKWLVAALAFVISIVVAPSTVFAQNAQVTGIVRDSSGAIIPGATVTARNVETGLTRVAVTDGEGLYRLPSLPPGLYAVSTELSGFSTETRPDIVLIIDQTAIINFSLKPATVSETVTVTGASPIVDVTRSDVSTSVSSQQIQDLPVASRRWIDLAMLTPGTSQDNIRGFFYRGNVNLGAGTREYSNGFVVDGVNNTWAEMGEPRQNFAMDAIQEFKVSTSTYKAEYGLATGGVVSVVTKSGTNQLHGSGLLFFRDASITAKEFFQTTKPDYRRYQYGGTIGGPIVQNKTHYFFAYEGTNENQFLTVNARGLWPQYEGTFRSAQERWTYNVKVNHQLSPSQTVFFRYGAEDEYRPIITTGGRTTPSASFDFAVPRKSAVVGHSAVLNDRALNDFRFQYAYAKYEVAPPYSHGDWAPADFTARLPLCTPVFSYPSILVGGCGNAQMGPESRWQIKDDFSYLMHALGGKHQWKAGFDFSYIPFEGDNTGSPLGSWTFPKDVPYDANDRTTWPTLYTNSLPTYANIPVKTYAGYLQDDWQAAAGLTFNLGVRYDLQKGSFNEDVPGLLAKIQDKLGRDGTFPFDVSIFPQPSATRGDRNNFGPRVGVAWDPANNGVMNLHAAYGLFYDNMRTLQNFNELTWPQAKTITIQNPTFPDPFGGRSRETFLSPTTPPTVFVGSNAQINMYAHQYNVGMNRLLTRELALSADFTTVLRYGDRDVDEINIPDQVTRQRPFPTFVRVNFWQPTADNFYKALLLKVEKRMSNHYQALLSYTLSKSDDDTFTSVLSDHYGYTKVKRPGVADRRHRLVASGIVALPFDMQVSAIGDFRSSLPFGPITSGLDLNNDTLSGTTVSAPANSDLPPGVLPVSGCRSLNLDAINTFRAARSLTAVSQVDCPTFANVDLRLSKFFRIGGSARAEFIAQLFNIFDRANFATPSNNIGAGNDTVTGRPLFGLSTSLLPNINAPSRQAEFAVRFQF